MNNDLISRQVAIDALEKKKDKKSQGDIGGFYNKIIQNDIDTLMLLPSADRPQGEWVDIEPRLNRRRVNKYKRCSHCGFSWARPFDDNFCPNCGARMLKGADDE